MAAELQYRAMDVGYAVSYPHFTQKSEEEGPGTASDASDAELLGDCAWFV